MKKLIKNKGGESDLGCCIIIFLILFLCLFGFFNQSCSERKLRDTLKKPEISLGLLASVINEAYGSSLPSSKLEHLKKQCLSKAVFLTGGNVDKAIYFIKRTQWVFVPKNDFFEEFLKQFPEKSKEDYLKR